MNTKLKANNVKEVENLKNWFKGRFPTASKKELKKFLNVITN